ncbi:phthalate transporter [Aspergillus sclerotialis]|uniref:Phthalate transporter n=1 Tax=Aspergillus sclerotialis TaxID=2070753 RepID=A0A3A2ZJF0_9EURO|nr:phthalate transporter [Aspergillus sclerotialis]
MSYTDDLRKSQEKFPASDEVSNIERQWSNGQDVSDREIRRIVHKVDRRLIPICGLLVAVSLLDRSNVSNANIAGMSKDLELTVGTRYSLVVLIFFAPYVVAEIPCAAIVRRIGPRWTLPSITVVWGIIVLAFGFVHDWVVLVPLRILLGILEAGLFPGLVYLMSLWYTRYELHKRYSFFYFIGLVGSALGGVLAFVFMQMDGLGGLDAWRWIFIMEGLITIVVGAAALIFLIDYPQNAEKAWFFLTANEANIILRRIEEDRSDTEADKKFKWSKFLRPAIDLTVWGYGFLYSFSTITAYSVAYFLPQILTHELGFSVGVSQLLTTPPYALAGLLMVAEGWLADKWQTRSPFLIYNALQTITGLCVLGFTSIPGVQYFGVFLVTSGCNANVPAVMSWQANNIVGHWTRTFCSAVLVAMGGLGGIIGALVFREQDAPKYLPGIYASIASNVLLIIVTIALTTYFFFINKKVRAGGKVIRGIPGFTYTI